MVEADIRVGSFWRRQQNGNDFKVLAVVDGFVMYRHRRYRPGVVTVQEWISDFRPSTIQASTVSAPSVGRRMRGRA